MRNRMWSKLQRKHQATHPGLVLQNTLGPVQVNSFEKNTPLKFNYVIQIRFFHSYRMSELR